MSPEKGCVIQLKEFTFPEWCSAAPFTPQHPPPLIHCYFNFYCIYGVIYLFYSFASIEGIPKGNLSQLTKMKTPLL